MRGRGSQAALAHRKHEPSVSLAPCVLWCDVSHKHAEQQAIGAMTLCLPELIQAAPLQPGTSQTISLNGKTDLFPYTNKLWEYGA